MWIVMTAIWIHNHIFKQNISILISMAYGYFSQIVLMCFCSDRLRFELVHDIARVTNNFDWSKPTAKEILLVTRNCQVNGVKLADILFSLLSVSVCVSVRTQSSFQQCVSLPQCISHLPPQSISIPKPISLRNPSPSTNLSPSPTHLGIYMHSLSALHFVIVYIYYNETNGKRQTSTVLQWILHSKSVQHVMETQCNTNHATKTQQRRPWLVQHHVGYCNTGTIYKLHFNLTWCSMRLKY